MACRFPFHSSGASPPPHFSVLLSLDSNDRLPAPQLPAGVSLVLLAEMGVVFTPKAVACRSRMWKSHAHKSLLPGAGTQHACTHLHEQCTTHVEGGRVPPRASEHLQLRTIREEMTGDVTQHAVGLEHGGLLLRAEG